MSARGSKLRTRSLNGVVRRIGGLSIVVLCLCAQPAQRVEARGAGQAATIRAVNDEVARIDRRIAAEDLPYLHSQYEEGPTEGAAPSFKFFFDAGASTLRACEVSVGHETWSRSFVYYFDASGRPLKYLEKIHLREDKPAPSAIIYGGDGRVVWKNIGAPRLAPEQIRRLYALLRQRSDAFAW